VNSNPPSSKPVANTLSPVTSAPVKAKLPALVGVVLVAGVLEAMLVVVAALLEVAGALVVGVGVLLDDVAVLLDGGALVVTVWVTVGLVAGAVVVHGGELDGGG
jgi:hypothetical protein